MKSVRRIIAGAAAAASALAVGSCGSGDPDWIGAAGVTVTADGHALVVIAVCSQHIDDVTVWNSGQAAEQSNSQPAAELNEQYRSVRPLTGTVRLDLAGPGPDWQPHPALDVTGSKQYVVLAMRGDKDAEVSQVSFSTEQLGSLIPGTVYANKDPEDTRLSPVSTVHDFTAHTCEHSDRS